MTQEVSNRIKLDRFVPRPYQLPVFDAVFNRGYKKIMLVMARRAGKDLVAWNIMVRAAITHVGTYSYCLPKFEQARAVIWDAIISTGEKFLDFIPPELISKKNEQQMKVTLINGSIIKLIGSDAYDSSIVGTNPRMIVFSECAIADERAYKQAALPIIKANDGTVILVSTPRGHNWFHELYKIAQNSPDWFCQYLTLRDTKHVSEEEIQKDIDSGELSFDMAQQEWYCSFDLGIEGSFFAKYIDRMRLAGQIGDVPWDPSLLVHTAWDIGRDTTAIIFFQNTKANTIRIIDYYENSKLGMEHYTKYVLEKPYQYGKHIGPHDIEVVEFGGGSRITRARNLGINFVIARKVFDEDGIEAIRATLPRVWIDQRRGGKLILALENFRQEYDAKLKIYKKNYLHDWSSHGSKSFQYLCIGHEMTVTSTTSQDIERHYQEAMRGDGNDLPYMFR